jgi:hypothetical protein
MKNSTFLRLSFFGLGALALSIPKAIREPSAATWKWPCSA